MSDRRPSVRTLKQAKAFVLQAGICGIFSDANGKMPCLWDVVDLPGYPSPSNTLKSCVQGKSGQDSELDAMIARQKDGFILGMK